MRACTVLPNEFSLKTSQAVKTSTTPVCSLRKWVHYDHTNVAIDQRVVGTSLTNLPLPFYSTYALNKRSLMRDESVLCSSPYVFCLHLSYQCLHTETLGC